MSCNQGRDRLSVYLDGELAANDEKLLQQHLHGCPECVAEMASLVSLHRAIKPAGMRFTPSAEFRRKIQAQIAPRRKLRLPWLWPMAVAGMAVLILAVVWTRQSAQRSEAFREVADLHISDLASANPYDVVSSDRHTVKPWFQGRIPFAFNLPEFAGTDFTLLGGRLVYLHQQPAAQIVVGVRQHKISVLILQETPALGASIPLTNEVAVRDSFNLDTWQNRGLRFFAIGDADKASIQRLAQAVQSVNQ